MQHARIRTVDVLRLAAEAHHDPRTVRKVLEGAGSPMTRSSVIAAAQRIGLELVPIDDAERPALRVRAT